MMSFITNGGLDLRSCLLHQVGLLPKDNQAQVPFAYKMYQRTDAEGEQLCAGFKQTYCQSVTIDFMGVWYASKASFTSQRRTQMDNHFLHRDTVASVGVIMGKTLPFTNSNNSIKTFRHALSLDEVCQIIMSSRQENQRSTIN